jgi:hypothetical protein
MDFATDTENEEQRFIPVEHRREMYEFIEFIAPPLANQSDKIAERLLTIIEEEVAKLK